MTIDYWVRVITTGVLCALHLWVGFRWGRALGRDESLEMLREMDKELRAELIAIARDK